MDRRCHDVDGLPRPPRHLHRSVPSPRRGRATTYHPCPSCTTQSPGKVGGTGRPEVTLPLPVPLQGRRACVHRPRSVLLAWRHQSGSLGRTEGHSPANLMSSPCTTLSRIDAIGHLHRRPLLESPPRLAASPRGPARRAGAPHHLGGRGVPID